MNVGIEASALGSGRGGDETFLRSLLAALALTARAGDRFPLYCAPGADVPAPGGLASFPIRRIARRPSVLRYAGALPFAAARERPRLDLLVSTNHAPLFSTVPNALVVHDVSFRRRPRDYSVAARLRLNALVPLQARAARLVITVSDFSRREIAGTLRIPPERIAVVPNAIAEARRVDERADQELRAALGMTGPYLLYVGNLHPRKNVARLVAAFARARSRGDAAAALTLVIAGAARSDADRVASVDGVRVLGRITDWERDALVRGAVALAYVSLYEGFGLPPLEAMAAGTPVIASRAGAIPEIAGDAALLVDPLDVDDIAAAIERLASDAALRARLRDAGTRRAQLFDHRTMGERALAAFEKAISQASIAGAVPARGSEA